jgi:hypothetical protein
MNRRILQTVGVGLLLLTACFAFGGVARADFGIDEADVRFGEPDGGLATQAGKHPYSFTTTFDLKTKPVQGGVLPEEEVKDVEISFPPGLVGAPKAVPRCASVDFVTVVIARPQCSETTVLGKAVIEGGFGPWPPGAMPITSPVFNLTPPPGVASKIGFNVLGTPVTIETDVSSDPPYRLVTHVTNVPDSLQFIGSKVTLWGVPADPAHTAERVDCLGSCEVSIEPVPFLTLPRACKGPLTTSFRSDSWQHPGVWTEPFEVVTHDDNLPPTPQGMTGCENLAFKPTIAAAPTTKAASSATGLDFSLNVRDEGLTSPTGIAHADIEKSVVTLPEGFTTNPSLAEGLGVCTEADLARETAFSAAGAGCPNAAKVGTVQVKSPLLDETLDGALYIAKPYENPFGSLIALYVVIKNPTLGISIKQPLRVELDPGTGRITTIAEDMPELPFSQFTLHFREGARSPLASPPGCGTYDTEALLYPSSGGEPIRSTSAFQLISGPDGGPCPKGGLPPFRPDLTAGTINNAAGRYSPFNVRISRTDSEQEITRFSIKLPPGVIGKLAGIPFCSDAAIAAAKSREALPHGGQEELDQPSCPAASEIGRTLVGSGVGSSPAYAPGKLYLAGPYRDSPISIVAITAARVGPFDLGTVVVREALSVNPETAEVFVDATGSDPIPHIINGVPVHLRDIRVYVDRPQFVLNPTNCKPTSTASTVLGSGLDFASDADNNPITVTSRFQAADCASLPFKPSLKLTLRGGTKRSGNPALRAELRMKPGEANVGRAQVTLPRALFLDQSHIGTVCTRPVFDSGDAPGQNCPRASIYGYARAFTPLLDQPLEGPVFLRSNGGERELPDLVAALNGQQIDVALVGYIDSGKRGGIRTTFATPPDAPVSKFVLSMAGGRKSLLENSVDLCQKKRRAKASFTGQNGKLHDFRPVIKSLGCKKK